MKKCPKRLIAVVVLQYEFMDSESEGAVLDLDYSDSYPD